MHNKRIINGTFNIFIIFEEIPKNSDDIIIEVEGSTMRKN